MLSRLWLPQLEHLVEIDRWLNLELRELICDESEATVDLFNVGRPRDQSVLERVQMLRLLLCTLLVFARCGWLRQAFASSRCDLQLDSPNLRLRGYSWICPTCVC